MIEMPTRPLSTLVLFLSGSILLFLYAATAWADWPEPLLPDAPRLDWGQVSGYFQRHQSDRSYSYIASAGLLKATESKSGKYDYYYSIEKWILVEHIAPPLNRQNQVVLASVKEFCSSNSPPQTTPHFRLLEMVQSDSLITIDFAMDIKLPQNMFAVPTDDLWQLFKADARSSDYKDEGYWYPIPESQSPQWFRDLVARTVLSGRFHCDDDPPR